MKSPNGPKTPALVQLMQWIADPFAFMHNCQERYGDCFTARVGANFRPQVFVSNPQAIEEILTGDTKQFEASGDVNEIFQPLVGEHGVSMMSGDRHRGIVNLRRKQDTCNSSNQFATARPCTSVTDSPAKSSVTVSGSTTPFP